MLIELHQLTIHLSHLRRKEGERERQKCIVLCLGQINNQSIVFVVVSLKLGSEYLAL